MLTHIFEFFDEKWWRKVCFWLALMYFGKSITFLLYIDFAMTSKALYFLTCFVTFAWILLMWWWAEPLSQGRISGSANRAGPRICASSLVARVCVLVTLKLWSPALYTPSSGWRQKDYKKKNSTHTKVCQLLGVFLCQNVLFDYILKINYIYASLLMEKLVEKQKTRFGKKR